MIKTVCVHGIIDSSINKLITVLIIVETEEGYHVSVQRDQRDVPVHRHQQDISLSTSTETRGTTPSTEATISVQRDQQGVSVHCSTETQKKDKLRTDQRT